jgi:hypothetical protein
MGAERSKWEPTYFRGVMLMGIGEGIRQRLRVSDDRVPDELARLLRRLDADPDAKKPELGRNRRSPRS